jgi:hypothetical protein
MSLSFLTTYKDELRVKWDNNVLIGPDINKPAFSRFPNKRTLVMDHQCPQCTEKIIPEQFNNDKSKKEYSISGFCQSCQDTMFNMCY